MRSVFAVGLLLLVSVPALANDTLESHAIVAPPFEVRGVDPMDFDLIDARADQREEEHQRIARRMDVEPHSIFIMKRHLGAAFGYDNGIVHTGVGLYLTVAELGRWNFGIPAVEFGLGRYPEYDAKQKMSFMKSQPTLLISLASVHYRVAYLRSFGVNWYLNLEQVYDMRTNLAGSQFGCSFASK